MKTQVLVAALAGLGTVGAANAAVVAVGIDTTTDSAWRTGAALEADNEYGTDGYIIYAIDQVDSIFEAYNPANDQNTLPAGVSIAGTPGATNTWSGNGNFGLIEDPGNANALTNTSLLAGVGGNDANNVYTISRGAGTSFRLTILLAEGDASGLVYASTVNDGSGAVTQTGVARAANGLDYHVFDVSAGSSDVVVSIAGNGNFSATGFAFDNGTYVPEPGSLALLGLGGLALLRRRRG